MVRGSERVSGRRGCVPRVTLCTRERGRAGRLFIGHCGPLQIQEHFGEKAGTGLAAGYRLERDGLLSRKDAALQLCVHVGREEELGQQGGAPGTQGSAPSLSLQLRDPKLREEDEGQRDLVFGELKGLSANRGLLLLTVALGPSMHVKWFGDTWGG